MTRMTRRMALTAAGTLAAALAPRNSRAEEPLRGFAAAWQPATPPKPPPPLSFTLQDGTQHGLAEYAGQGVVLNLWATWCVPCVAEMPALDSLARQVAADRIVVLALSSDRQGARLVDGFFMTHGVHDLPVVLDPRGEAARALGARGIPTTLIIDRQGREVGRLEGAVAWGDPATVEAVKRLVGSSA